MSQRQHLAYDLATSLRAILDRQVGRDEFSGVCLVTRGDETVLHEAYGLAHRGYGIQNTIETRFDIASITKLFTAVAVMQVVRRGDIALDTRLMPYLDIRDTRISDDVTVFHCLTHTSGIGDDADEVAGEEFEALFIDKPNYSIRETRDFLPQFVDKDPVFAPGESVRYNNVAFILLGLAIERVSGLSYRDYVVNHIFRAAGLDGAGFCAMDGVNERLAEHYKRIPHPDGSIEYRKNIYSYPPVGDPAGGATVTARDLERFLRLLRNGDLLGAEATRQMLSPHSRWNEGETGSEWYGFAVQLRRDPDGQIVEMGKDGINAGVASMLAYYPGTDTTLVLLANQDSDVWQMTREIEPLIA